MPRGLFPSHVVLLLSVNLQPLGLHFELVHQKLDLSHFSSTSPKYVPHATHVLRVLVLNLSHRYKLNEVPLCISHSIPAPTQ